MIRSLAAGVLSLGLVTQAAALPIEDFQLPGIVYDSAVETPDTHFRHGLGDKPVRHDQLVSYLKGLSGASDRIDHEVIGYTHEGRPILLLKITSPRNHARLESIRTRHLKALKGGAHSEQDPAIIWINYGVHGAESSGMDAVAPVAYHYAAARGAAVEKQLDEAVILMVAILNPDGHARRIDHVETFGGAVQVTDPGHHQHNLWTAARTNHYWFDLNRQWLLTTQPESKAWVEAWHRWKPMVSGDYHEMGSNSTYYFHPGEPKRLNPLVPDQLRSFAKGIANVHREWLDSEARLYYTEQGFDNFYVGKGSTYPQVNGSIGILFEAGAARGGEVESPSGGREYGDNIRTHYRTTLTTIEGTLRQKKQIAEFQREFFAGAKQAAADHDVKAYVISTKGDRTRLHRFVEVLRRHQVDVHALTEDVTVGRVTYRAGEALIVPLDQIQHTMVRGIFDRVTEFEENIFYDVSGWTLPLAYDIDHAPLKERLTRGEDAAKFAASLVGQAIEAKDIAPKVQAPKEASYGYVFGWEDFNAPRALNKLLRNDVLVRIASDPFELRTDDGVHSFAPGAVFVPLIRQSKSAKEIHKLIREIAAEENIKVHAATSGASDDATRSAGGGSFRPVQEPHILLLFNDGFANYDVGEVWHLLDYEMRVPVTLRRKDSLESIDWSRYTDIVMVGGGNVSLSNQHTERLEQWIREEGGTLIALRQSATWAQRTLLKDKPRADSEEAESKQRFDYKEMRVRDAEHIIGGAIVATDLDTSHPLGFGYGDRLLPMQRNTTATLAWPEGNPYAVVSAYPEGGVLMSGYISEKRQVQLAGTPAVVAEPMGRGNVIMIADNPVFRGTFLGSNKLFLNAIFFGDMINRPSGEYVAGGHVHDE
ncbi:MAG: peptidase [Parvularculaceae bacterium]|nr:peptidase [Parvularculaceae bacterium]